jgi:hypothetical protein
MPSRRHKRNETVLGAELALAPLIPVFCPEGREGEKPLFLPGRYQVNRNELQRAGG